MILPLIKKVFYKFMVDPMNGHIIITSRLKDWNDKTIDLNEFELKESIDLLENRTELGDRKGAKLLAEKLGNYPLALDQAGMFIKRSGQTYREYLKSYQNSFNYEKPDKYHSTIARTFDISMKKILKENKCSAELINIISLFAHTKIPISIFEEGKDILSRKFRKIIKEKKFTYLLLNIANYSLINLDNGYIVVHKLVQDTVRDKIDQKKW